VAQVSGLQLTDPGDSSVWRYDIVPTEEGRAFRTKTIPWEDSMPTTPWVKNLFPFDAGASRTKDTNKRGLQLAAQNPTDTFLPEFILPGPANTALTLTNATQQVLKWIYAKDTAGNAMFGICGRYLIRVDAITKAVGSQDLGSSRVASDVVQINGDLIICFSSSHFIQRRNPGGTLSASTDKYAKSIVIVRDQIWSVGTSAALNNTLSYIRGLNATDATALLTAANWTTSSPAYVVGDGTYQCYQLYDVAGTLAGGRPDGIFMPDPETKFLNVTPQIARSPDAGLFTGYGCWMAFGELWVPYQRGVLRVSPGNATDEGPGTAYLPGLGLRVVGGIEWDRMMYIAAVDWRTYNGYILKMIPDKRDIADGQWIFQPVAYISGNSTHFVRAIGMASPATANPFLVYGGGSAATAASYITLGRGPGRDVDDSAYLTRTGVSYLTTGMFSPGLDASQIATLVGSQVWVGATDETTDTSPVIVYYNSADSQMPGNGATTAMATEAGGGTTSIVDSGLSTRYAAANTQGKFFNMKLGLTSTGTLMPAVLGWTAFGYLNPAITDEITMQVEVRDANVTMGQFDMAGYTAEQMTNKLRDWCNRGFSLAGQLEGYATDLRDDNRNVRFMVRSVGEEHSIVRSAAGTNVTESVNVVDLVLVRVDMSGEYGEVN
jgi:hypothetical protein